MTPIDRLVLDTSAYAHLRAGHPRALDCAADAAVIIMPVTVLGELEAGFELGRRARENRRALAEFLDEPFVGILDVTTRPFATTAEYSLPCAGRGRQSR